MTSSTVWLSFSLKIVGGAYHKRLAIDIQIFSG